LGEDRGHWEGRHFFHRRHRRKFMVLIGAGALWCVWAGLALLSKAVFGYGLLVGVLVGAYFILTVDARRKGSLSLGKNLVAAVAFAMGVASAAHAYAPFLSMGGMLTEVELWLFAALCFWNISAIDFWVLAPEDEEDASGLLAFGTLAVAAVAMFFASRVGIYQRPYFYAVLVGVAALYFLNRCRGNFSMEARRVLVDVALLLPPTVYWFWMRLYVVGVL
ncbi:MAG: hypothetical protein ACQKBY_03360, partial [Verrucomicrobiales bacterium]